MFSKSIVKPIFFVCVCVMIFIAAMLFLAPDRSAKKSLISAACVFDNKEPHCFELDTAWQNGLAYYDKLLKATDDTVLSVKALIWEYWRLEFAGNSLATQPEAILPSQVLKYRKTGCVGVTWLALMLAEARGLRIDVYLLPGHIYFAVNGQNLEPNRGGFNYTHEEYRRKYAVTSWTGYEQKPLYRNQFLGIVAFNLGNSELDKDPRAALTWYKVASDFFPAYPRIADNRRIALRRLNDGK